MIKTAIKKYGDTWLGVAMDQDQRLLTCSFSLKGREYAERGLLSGLLQDTQTASGNDDKHVLSALENLDMIWRGLEPKANPILAWDRLPPFHSAALRLTAKVPRGSVATYGGIAAGLGRPKAARAVGNAEASNPFAPLVPCHRVIASDLGLGGYGSGLPVKKALLIREGVAFNGERVSVNSLWRPEEGKYRSLMAQVDGPAHM